MKTTMMLVAAMSVLTLGVSRYGRAEGTEAPAVWAAAQVQPGPSRGVGEQIAPEKHEKLFQKLDRICKAHPRLCAYYFKQRFNRLQNRAEGFESAAPEAYNQYAGTIQNNLEPLKEKNPARYKEFLGKHPYWKDRLEDIRDKREDIKDRSEDVRDRAEDYWDRREDIWDARHDGGKADRLEDIYDRREDKQDRREDRWDRKEDVRDRRENVQDRKSGGYGRKPAAPPRG
jgi:hypothetical protein